MRLLAVVGLLAAAAAGRTQGVTVRTFLALNAKGALNHPAGKRILAEEAGGWPASFGPLAPVPDRLVRVSPDFAAARVQGLGPDRKPSADLYFYLRRKAGVWRIVAFRTLAQTGLVAVAREELRKKKALTPEERAELRNMDLVLSSDRDLRIYFAGHRKLLEEIAGRTSRDAGPNLKRDLEKIGFTDAERSGRVVRLSIGGVLDNTVGFLKVEAGGKAPEVSPSEYIWVEPLGGGWFLFKTT